MMSMLTPNKLTSIRGSGAARAQLIPGIAHRASSGAAGLRHVARAAASPTIAEKDQLKLEELMKRFKDADSDGNGKICREELRALLESTKSTKSNLLTQLWLPDEELDRVLKMYDADGSGTIEFEEFKNLVYDGLLLDDKLGEYLAAFRAVDRSGNGSIGAVELAQLFQALGQPISYEKLVTVMQKYDKDESGQIEFNEFMQMFRGEMLFDLDEVTKYLATLPAPSTEGGAKGGAAGSTTFQPLTGDLNPIFAERELDEALEACKGQRLVVVFGALTWCRPCKSMQRPVQKLAEAYAEQAVFLKVFGNSNRQTKALFKDRLEVRSTPSFIIFKDGQVVCTQTGANKELLETNLRAHMDPAKLPQQLVFQPVAKS